MRTRTRVVLAATGLSAVLAVGVPAVALADGGSSGGSGGSSSGSGTTAACDHPLAGYLKAHPDVQAELKKIRALPADRRKAERQSYLAQHPDVKAALQQAGQAAKGDLAARLGSLGDDLAAHPEVADLLDQLRNAPAGQRAQAARQFLDQHPDLRAQLKAVRTQLRADRAACRAGAN